MVTATEYRLAPPDVIRLTSKRVRELHGHVETIRPDGKITLPLVGSVYVTGKTPEQASAEIQTLAQEYYEDADVSLRVEVFRSKKIFVFGEVGMVGAYPYDGTNTVLRTLASAQPTRLADPQRIQVMRPNGKGQMVARMTINLNKMIKEGDTSLDAVLEEGDIIYVPANPLASAGLAMQQLLLPLQPAAQTVQAPADIATYGQKPPYNRGSEN
jgi:polysaccharide export outer membrane protein